MTDEEDALQRDTESQAQAESDEQQRLEEENQRAQEDAILQQQEDRNNRRRTAALDQSEINDERDDLPTKQFNPFALNNSKEDIEQYKKEIAKREPASEHEFKMAGAEGYWDSPIRVPEKQPVEPYTGFNPFRISDINDTKKVAAYKKEIKANQPASTLAFKRAKETGYFDSPVISVPWIGAGKQKSWDKKHTVVPIVNPPRWGVGTNYQIPFLGNKRPHNYDAKNPGVNPFDNTLGVYSGVKKGKNSQVIPPLTADIYGGAPIPNLSPAQQAAVDDFKKKRANAEAAALEESRKKGRQKKAGESEYKEGQREFEGGFLAVPTEVIGESRNMKQKVNKEGTGVIAPHVKKIKGKKGEPLITDPRKDPDWRAPRVVVNVKPDEMHYFPLGIPKEGVTRGELSEAKKRYESKEAMLAYGFVRAETARETAKKKAEEYAAGEPRRKYLAEQREIKKYTKEFNAIIPTIGKEKKEYEAVKYAEYNVKLADAFAQSDKTKEEKLEKIKVATKAYHKQHDELERGLLSAFEQSEKDYVVRRKSAKSALIDRMVSERKEDRAEAKRKELYQKHQSPGGKVLDKVFAQDEKLGFGFGGTDPWNKQYREAKEKKLSDAYGNPKLTGGVLMHKAKDAVVGGAVSEVKRYHSDLVAGRNARAALLAQRSFLYGGGLQPTSEGHFPHKSGKTVKPPSNPLTGSELLFFGRPFGTRKAPRRTRRGKIIRMTAAQRKRQARAPKGFFGQLFGR